MVQLRVPSDLECRLLNSSGGKWSSVPGVGVEGGGEGVAVKGRGGWRAKARAIDS